MTSLNLLPLDQSCVEQRKGSDVVTPLKPEDVKQRGQQQSLQVEKVNQQVEAMKVK